MKQLEQAGLVLWFTGLSGAGKSTLASGVSAELRASGLQSAVVDGDRLRAGLCRDLGFSLADRSENIRRAAELTRVLADAGLVVCVALITPLEQQRAMAESIIGRSRFLLVHVDASLNACEERDPKGLYARARRGELTRFTGIDSPWERPQSPTWRVDTETQSVGPCVARLVRLVAQHQKGPQDR